MHHHIAASVTYVKGINAPIWEGTGEGASVKQIYDWIVANNIDFSQVVDLYHNHDFNTYGLSSDSALINRYPSVNDWNTAYSYFIRMGADPSVFTLSLEDTDHVVRDFDYSDRPSYTNLGDSQKQGGDRLPTPVH